MKNFEKPIPVCLYAHTHQDREWYRNFESFRLRFLKIFDDVLKKLETGELISFYLDGQTVALEDYLELFPGKEELIKKYVKEERLYIGPFYCSADEFLITGESLLRNLKIGIEISEKVGCKDFTGYLCDVFGHSEKLPYILKAANINTAVIWRGAGHLPVYSNWNGIDVVKLPYGYFQDILHTNIPLNEKINELKKLIDKISEKSPGTVLLPIGADHLKAVDDLPKIIEEFNKLYGEIYELKQSTIFEYFKTLKDIKKTFVTGELRDNSEAFLLPGVYSSRTDIKRANVITQRNLTEVTEPLQALSHFFFGKENFQKSCDYAYKILVKNHAHDSIYACSIDEVSKEVLLRYEKVNTVANDIKKYCIQNLSEKKKGFSLINLSNSNFTGVIEFESAKEYPQFVKISERKGFSDEILYDISKIPITEDYNEIYKYLVPVTNAGKFAVSELKGDLPNVKCGKNFIENEYVKIEVSEARKIKVTDKITGREIDDFLQFKDFADIGDSYNFAPLKDDIPITFEIKEFKTRSQKISCFLNVKFKTRIPLFSDKNGRSKEKSDFEINLKFRLFSGMKTVKCEAYFDNTAENHILKAVFKINGREIICEDLFGTIKRNAISKNKYEFPATNGKEILFGTIPIQRFFFADKMCVITEGLQEILPKEKNIEVTFLRATGIISNPKNPSRGNPAGPPIETPNLQMKGLNKSFFAFAFADNENETYKLADNYFNPPLIVENRLDNIEFFKLSNKNTRVCAIKLSDENLIVRLRNNSEKVVKCDFTANGHKIFETDLTEKNKKPFKNVFQPFEIKTLKIIQNG